MAKHYSYIFVLICITAAPTAYAQITIRGNVLDEHKVPVPGANVFLLGTYDGTSSKADGTFEFTTTEVGSQILTTTFIGYKDFHLPVTLAAVQLEIAVILEETINELEAVTITAGNFSASDVSRRTMFKALDIATTAGATADIAGALNTLPGTQKVGEAGRLFVRGGDGSETRTFIDGMVVLDAYKPSAANTPSRGRFLPFMFKGTSFSTGGYSAEYGQALSSVLALDSKDKAESTRTDIGILSVGADVAHTQAWARGSAAGKIQYTNLRPYMALVKQETAWKTPPVSLEGVAVFRHQVSKSGLFKLYGNFNETNYTVYNHEPSDINSRYEYALTNNYRYVNGTYDAALNENWNVRSGLAYNAIQNDSRVDWGSVRESERGVHAKGVIQGSLSAHWELTTGAEVIQRAYDLTYRQTSEDSTSGFDETIVSAFAESDVYASNAFVIRTGARLEYNTLIRRGGIDPRVSMAYKTDAHGQLSLAYGKFRQTATNELVGTDSHLGAEKAQHLILNYQRIEHNRTFRIETYYKRYSNLVKYVNGDSRNLHNEGIGYAKGIELFWRDNGTFKNVDYWISYSFLDTKRDYLNFPGKATPSFASVHNFSVVYKQFIQPIKTQLGATYSFASGRPYNDPNTGSFNAGKTPYYADLSFNAAYLAKPFLIIYFSCTNLLGRDNVFGYEYSTVPDSNGVYAGRAIRQAATRFLFVGIFITLSKDKSVNQLPSL